MKQIKNYKSMSKEGLLIAVLKSVQCHTKLYRSKSNNSETEEIKKMFNELRNRLSKEKRKKNLERALARV